MIRNIFRKQRSGRDGADEAGREVKRLRGELKKVASEFEQIQRNAEFWKREFKKRQPTKKCPVCKAEVDLWPFESEGYYIKNNRVWHHSCYGKEQSDE